eukprot:FR742024.1.p2 GENE.FR742024.1~~FR742024.1.p2  ORF type:complete len:170 (+),score=11.88 FR742024.1:64-510(+)
MPRSQRDIPDGHTGRSGPITYDLYDEHEGMSAQESRHHEWESGPEVKRRATKQTRSRANARGGRWLPEEHALFIKGKAIHGRSWTKVAEVVGTRTTVQVRSHAQKYEIKCQRERQEISHEHDHQMHDMDDDEGTRHDYSWAESSNPDL